MSTDRQLHKQRNTGTQQLQHAPQYNLQMEEYKNSGKGKQTAAGRFFLQLTGHRTDTRLVRSGALSRQREWTAQVFTWVWESLCTAASPPWWWQPQTWGLLCCWCRRSFHLASSWWAAAGGQRSVWRIGYGCLQFTGDVRNNTPVMQSNAPPPDVRPQTTAFNQLWTIKSCMYMYLLS